MSAHIINGKPIESLRVVDLKEELGKHGLNKNGKKQELIDRLSKFLDEQASAADVGSGGNEVQEVEDAPAAAEAAAPPLGSPNQLPNLGVDDSNNDFVKAYLAVRQSNFEQAVSPRREAQIQATEIVDKPAEAVEEPEPVVEKTPVKEPTPEPVKEPTPEPVKEPTPEPVKEPTPEFVKEPTPEPVKEPSPEPEPVKEPTPEPIKEPTPEPIKEPTPEPVKEPTPEPVKEPSPDPVKEPTPEPEAPPPVAKEPEPKAVSPEPVVEKKVHLEKPQKESLAKVESVPEPKKVTTEDSLDAPEADDVVNLQESVNFEDTFEDEKDSTSKKKEEEEQIKGIDTPTEEITSLRKIGVRRKNSQEDKKKTSSWGSKSATPAKAKEISSQALKDIVPDAAAFAAMLNKEGEKMEVEEEEEEEKEKKAEKRKIEDSEKENEDVDEKKEAPVKRVRRAIEAPKASDSPRPAPTTSTALPLVEAPITDGEKKDKILPSVETACIAVLNLVRPFTANLLKGLLSRTGTLVEKNGFYLDKIKSRAYVKYETNDQAAETIMALDDVKWPQTNPKKLSVKSVSAEEFEQFREFVESGEPRRLDPANGIRPKDNRDSRKTENGGEAQNGRSRREERTRKRSGEEVKDEKSEGKKQLEVDGKPRAPSPKPLDVLFNKTKTQPPLYWKAAKEVSEAKEEIKNEK